MPGQLERPWPLGTRAQDTDMQTTTEHARGDTEPPNTARETVAQLQSSKRATGRKHPCASTHSRGESGTDPALVGLGLESGVRVPHPWGQTLSAKVCARSADDLCRPPDKSLCPTTNLCTTRYRGDGETRERRHLRTTCTYWDVWLRALGVGGGVGTTDYHGLS